MYRAKRLSGFVERESGCAFRTLQTAGRPRHMARPPAGTSAARPRTVGRSRPRRASELDTLGRRGICCRVPAGKKGLADFYAGAGAPRVPRATPAFGAEGRVVPPFRWIAPHVRPSLPPAADRAFGPVPARWTRSRTTCVHVHSTQTLGLG